MDEIIKKSLRVTDCMNKSEQTKSMLWKSQISLWSDLTWPPTKCKSILEDSSE